LAHETVVPKDLPSFDLSRFGVEEEIMASHPDVVIHAGAYTDVDGAEREPERAMAVNAEGTGQVARAAARVGAKLVYMSTDYVFDGLRQMPYREEDTPRPLNQYGMSKWRGEEAVVRSGAQALIVRTAWLYGRSGKNFVQSIMQAAQTQSVLKVVDDQRGCPTCAEDLASALATLIRQDVTGILHMTNRGDCTWYEFAQAIIQEMGIPVPVLPITTQQAGRPAKRPAYSVLTSDRLCALGIVLPHWRESLRRFMSGQRVPLAASN
jgi:dTDP-4-dehydrorhamnose reductase